MTLKKCPSCGHQHDSADIVCPYCKYSYSDKKFQCNNCGAYLKPTDKVCYVCGKVAEIQKIQVSAPPTIEEKTTEAFENTNTYSVDINENIPDNNDYDSIDEIESRKQPQKTGKKSKKALVICSIFVIVVALIAAGVCVCYLQGWLPVEKEQATTMTVYFDKPSSNQNLLDSQGTVYSWRGDVDINYTSKGQSVTEACKMTLEYDNIWYCEIPIEAKDVYFSQSTVNTIRTNTIKELNDNYIYYVTDIVFNNGMQLPISGCILDDFDNFGINYQNTTTPVTTETVAEETDETVDETTETEGQDVEEITQTTGSPNGYDISMPQQWQENVTVVNNGNCTSYYEKYNYENYQCGNLISIYTFDKNDNSYSEMNVKKIITDDNGDKIVIVTPTDIQFNDSDEEAITKYTDLSQYTSQVMESVQVK